MKAGDIAQRVGHPEIVAQVLWGGTGNIIRLVRLEMRGGVPKYGAGEPFKGQVKDWVAWAPSSHADGPGDGEATDGAPNGEMASGGAQEPGRCFHCDGPVDAAGAKYCLPCKIGAV